MHATLPLLCETSFPAISRRVLETLQVNLGYRCNQSCQHCHVNAGPKRTEQMTGETIGTVLDFLAASSVAQLDLTGGAPELNPHFRELVVAAGRLGVRVIDRCNLTILSEPGQEDLAGVSRRQSSRDRRLAALLSGRQCRSATRQGGLPFEHRRSAPAKRAGLRRARIGARSHPRLQSSGAEPSARAGLP